MPNRDKALIAIVVIITLAILAGGHDNGHFAVFAKDAEGQFERNFTVSGPVQLTVENGSGSVNVRRGGSGSVSVHAEIRTNHWMGGSDGDVHEIEQNPPVKQDGNNIRISKVEGSIGRHVSINYEITVPETTTVEAHTGSGSQTVEMLDGPVTLSTGSGSIRVHDVNSATKVQTGSGSIEINDIRGAVQAKTGSGSIQGEAIGGAFKGETGSGHMEIRLTAPGDVSASTGSGHLSINGVDGGLFAESGSGHIEVSGTPRADWKLHAGSGGVDVRIQNNVGFNVDAHAGSGSVNVAGPITMESSSTDHHSVRGQIRGGGPEVNVTSGSGSISID
jgi:Putative adhesin